LLKFLIRIHQNNIVNNHGSVYIYIYRYIFNQNKSICKQNPDKTINDFLCSSFRQLEIKEIKEKREFTMIIYIYIYILQASHRCRPLYILSLLIIIYKIIIPRKYIYIYTFFNYIKTILI